MEIREINEIANDFSKLTSNIGLIQNYISCLSLQAEKSKSSDESSVVFYSLTYEKGFDHLADTLENISDKINSLVNELNSLEEKVM